MATLVQKVVSIVPVECLSNVSNELGATANLLSSSTDPIYYLFGQPDGVLFKAIIDGLSYFDKSSGIVANIDPSNAASNTLTTASNCLDILANTLLLLKSASVNNPQYIDRAMAPFMKVLQKLHRDHLSAASCNQVSSSQVPLSSTSAEGSNMIPGPNSSSVTTYSELLIQSLDLIKYRVGVMSVEMRKLFVNSILASLVEKSVDVRVVRYVLKLVAEWVRYKAGPLLNQIPAVKEKLILMQKLAMAMEKRFAEHADLQQIFLETVAFVYKDETYAANIETKAKLESAFLLGLKTTNPEVRHTFVELFNSTFGSTDIYERLCYIIVSQNWESFGAHYWVKQCIQMTLGACARSEGPLVYADTSACLRMAAFLSAPLSIFGQNDLPPHNEPINDAIVAGIETALPQLPSLSPLASLDQIAEGSEYTEKSMTIYFKPEDNNPRTREGLIAHLVQNQFALFDYGDKVSI